MSCLHEDVWILVAHRLSIPDVIALSQSCRHLRSILGDRSIWLRILQDIFAVSPNPLLALQLPSMSADELRAAVNGFLRVHEKLAAGRADKFHMSIIPVNAPMILDAALIPGSSFLLRILSSGSVDLVSTENKMLVVEWTSEISQIVHAALTICCSRRFGIMVLAVVDYEGEGEFNRQLWLLQVQCKPCVALVPLVVNPTMEFVELASAHDNVMLFSWEEPTHEMIAILDIPTALTSDTLEPSTFRLSSEYRNSNINQYRILNHRRFLVFTDLAISLFNLPATSSSPDDPLGIAPCWMYPIAFVMGAFYGPTLSPTSAYGYLLRFSTYDTCYEVEVPEYPDAAAGSASLRQYAGVSERVAEMHVGGAWSCYSSPVARGEATWFNLCFSSDSKLAAEARLTQLEVGPRSSQISVSTLPKGDLFSLNLDEWTGRVMVHWWTTSEDEETTRSQLILLSLRPAARR